MPARSRSMPARRRRRSLHSRAPASSASAPRCSTTMHRCRSRASTEMLLAAAQGTEPSATIIREAHTSISAIAEKAMGRAVSGAPAEAVQMLLDEGAGTRNAKLIELAGLVAQRHQEKIDDVESLTAAARELMQRYCSKGAQLMGARSGGRAAGGMRLRA